MKWHRCTSRSHIQSPHHAQAQQVDYVVEHMNEKVTKHHVRLEHLPQQLRYLGNAVMSEIKKGQDVD